MKHTIYLEPLSEDSPVSDEAYEGVSLNHLREIILQVPGVEKIYPKIPYLVQAARLSYSLLSNLSQAESPADSGDSRAGQQPPTLTVRLGISPNYRAPEVARAVGQALATELPGKPISVEVASC